MCRIVGYMGHRKAYPILIKGLKRLEYRGYDSTGVDISGNIGIVHPRWTSHGEPCFSYVPHPYYSSSERLALIHNNGIIENSAVLKEKLQAKSYTFKDTCMELPGTMECLDPLITTVPIE